MRIFWKAIRDGEKKSWRVLPRILEMSPELPMQPDSEGVVKVQNPILGSGEYNALMVFHIHILSF